MEKALKAAPKSTATTGRSTGLSAWFAKFFAAIGRFFLNLSGHNVTREEAIFEAIFASMSDAVLVADLEGEVTMINAGAEQMFDLDAPNVRGHNIFHLCADNSTDRSRISSLLVQHKTVRNFSTELRGPGGLLTPALITIDFVKHPGSRKDIAIVSVIKDNGEIVRKMQTDGLTGVYNRRHLDQKIEETYEWLRRGHMDQISVIFIDLDSFGPVNKNYGHDAGDQILRDVGQVLRRGLRVIDTVARYGGEEFVLILPNTDTLGAQQVAERIRKEISEIVVRPSRDVEISITASIGIQTHLGAESTGKQLVSEADRAMRLAKRNGKNQTIIYSNAIERVTN